ncbi:MAG TPA: TonB family protein [Acidobacteriaceae bacterium]|nr:TonB family protein [Acidobacteriaceae bacterium]
MGSTLLSVAAHAVVAAVVVLSLRMHPVQVFSLPGTDLGTRVELSYLPGRAPVPAPHPQVRVKPKAVSGPEITPSPVVPAAPDAIHLPPLPHLTVTETAPSPNVASPASATPDSSTGSDSYGSGSIQIALTTYSPSPVPDLSALPHGVQGDVIVDVTIDPNGKVADLAVLHTLGYGIETSVIGTLKTWTFRPATKDGAPIASVQELHFHFGPV